MRRILLVVMLLANGWGLRAQELTAGDSAEVQQKALRHVRQFEGLLNLVAQPDKYFRKYSFAKLIQSFYDKQSDYQIFRDSLVAVEDNLNPNADPAAENLLTVKDYLKAFFSFYEKSPVASVFFSNYEVSPVRQGDFTYVEVYYTSEFTNRHRAYPNQAYPVRHQKATLRAEPREDGWAVLISDISYESPGKSSPGEPSPGEQPVVLPLDDTLRVASRGDEPVENLSDALADSSRTWQVLDKIDRGSDYQLSIYDSVEVLKSPTASLPRVDDAFGTEAFGNQQEAFKGFVPFVRRAGKSSIQVVFDNPANDSLTVTLTDPDKQVRYSEKVAGKQHYVQSINLKNLTKGAYRVSVFNDHYHHAERILYQAVKTTNPLGKKEKKAKFKPYVTQENRESVQVILYNPTNDSLAVELTDIVGEVLYSEKVASKGRYAKSINLKSLNQGSYRLRIRNDDYSHTVRVYR